MWQKSVLMRHSVRLKLIREGLLVYLANNYTTGGAFGMLLFFSFWLTAKLILLEVFIINNSALISDSLKLFNMLVQMFNAVLLMFDFLFWLNFWLVGWVLWHIKLCWFLYN